MAEVDWERFYGLEGNRLNTTVVATALQRVGLTNVWVLEFQLNRPVAGFDNTVWLGWGRSGVRTRYERVGSKAGVTLWEPRGTWRPDAVTNFSGFPSTVFSAFLSTGTQLFPDTVVAPLWRTQGGPEPQYRLLLPPRHWWAWCETNPFNGNAGSPKTCPALEDP